jgi:hypothetical protein
MSKKPKTLEQKIYNALIGRPHVADAITDKQQSLPIIRQVLAQHRITSFCADDIRVFLARNLPRYYLDSEIDMEEEDFLYIVKPEDIERVSQKLFELFKANGDN